VIKSHHDARYVEEFAAACRRYGLPVTVQRRVSSRGGIMVATQKIQVGLIHAGKIVTVTAEDHSFRLIVDGQAVRVVPRTTTREIHRYKAYAAHPRPGRR